MASIARNEPIIAVCNTNKQIRNSFTLSSIDFHAPKIMIGVKNVVNKISIKEIPSIPIKYEIPKRSIQENFSVICKAAEELSNLCNNVNDAKNSISEKPKAKCLIVDFCGQNEMITAKTIGKNNKIESVLEFSMATSTTQKLG